jgi:hypothetical protein
MYLNDFKREYTINSLEELNEILLKRYTHNANYFILTFQDEGFPQLTAFVKANEAVLYYLDTTESFISESTTKTETTAIFYENEYFQILLPKASILPITDFYKAAELFFITKSKPINITWTAL